MEFEFFFWLTSLLIIGRLQIKQKITNSIFCVQIMKRLHIVRSSSSAQLQNNVISLRACLHCLVNKINERTPSQFLSSWQNRNKTEKKKKSARNQPSPHPPPFYVHTESQIQPQQDKSSTKNRIPNLKMSLGSFHLHLEQVPTGRAKGEARHVSARGRSERSRGSNPCSPALLRRPFFGETFD